VPDGLAWSFEDAQDEDDERPRPWRNRLVSAALVVLLCATTAAVAWLSSALWDTEHRQPQATPTPTAAPAPTPTAAQAPAAPTVTSTTTVTNPAPPPPPTTPPPAPTTPPTRTPALAPNTAAYIRDLTADGVPYRSRSDLITTGMNMCQALREGLAPEAAINAATRGTSYRDNGGFIIGSAARNLCPDQQPTVDAWSDSQ
jgi:type IV secretory pathway VirB10-like protein